jgi:2-C-methyl-D-erythritol 4-phosphate cytidylyltransferase
VPGQPTDDDAPAEGGAVWTIVVAAGSGSRFGAAKQFAALGSQRVLDHAVEVAAASSDGVVVVAPADALEIGSVPSAASVVAGGATRSESVRRGLAAVPDDATVVVVHDAARPLARADLFAATVDAVRSGAAGAVPAVPVTDSLRHETEGPVDRAHLVAVQTPQAFRADRLRAAHERSPEATDDAAVVEADGGRIVVVPGDRWNVKITEPEDLVVAAALLEARR